MKRIQSLGSNALNTIEVNQDNKQYTIVDCVLFSGTTLVQYACGKNDTYIIPDFVTEIGQWAFAHCTSLKSVVMPKNVTIIQVCAFLECSGLTDLQLSEGLKAIGCEAFEGCSNLRSVTLLTTVESIDNFAFRECFKLESVIYLGNKNPGSTLDTFDEYPLLDTICVPTNCNSSSFLGRIDLCKSDACEDLAAQANQCFEMSCNENIAVITKRKNVTLWEEESDGCIKFKCDNNSGIVPIAKCESSGEVCLNGECLDNNQLNNRDGSVAVIEIDAFKLDTLNRTSILLNISKLADVDVDRIQITIDVDENGEVQHIIVITEDEASADDIAHATNAMNKADDCDQGMLCRSTSAQVAPKEHTVSEANGFSSLFIPFAVIVLLHFIN